MKLTVQECLIKQALSFLSEVAPAKQLHSLTCRQLQCIQIVTGEAKTVGLPERAHVFVQSQDMGLEEEVFGPILLLNLSIFAIQAKKVRKQFPVYLPAR